MTQLQSEKTMTINIPHRLLPTSWLAQKLNISVTTIERLRVKRPEELPPHLSIGKSIRYDDRVVDAWLQKKMGNLPSLPVPQENAL